MFGRKKKADTPEQVAVLKQAEADDQVDREKETALIIAWRRSYDQDRANALAEGRGCGLCIEGVVKFGRAFGDEGPCNCKFAKEPETPTEPASN